MFSFAKRFGCYVKQGNKKKASEKKKNEPKNISIEHIFVYLFGDYFFMHSHVDR